jgi:predicted enzyme related to lactoylglutathione lyase
MIQRLGIASVYVLDQESAKRFFTQKLGFTLHDDAAFGQYRWLTVCPPGQPDLRIALMAIMPTPMMDQAKADALRQVVSGGGIGCGAFETDDCQATYAELSAKGVRFLSPPTRRPYGLEAIMADDSGNWYSITQRT